MIVRLEPYSWKSEAGNVWPVSSVLSSQLAGGLWSERADSGIRTKQLKCIIKPKIKILPVFKAKVDTFFQFLVILVESLF